MLVVVVMEGKAVLLTFHYHIINNTSVTFIQISLGVWNCSTSIHIIPFSGKDRNKFRLE